MQAWEKDSSFPYAENAGVAWRAIERNLEFLMLDYKFPWNTKIDPAKLGMDDLRNIYASREVASGHPNLKLGLLQYIADRSDITEKSRLQFFIDVMHNDTNLKAVAYAGQGFSKVAHLDVQPLALSVFSDWWKENAGKF